LVFSRPLARAPARESPGSARKAPLGCSRPGQKAVPDTGFRGRLSPAEVLDRDQPSLCAQVEPRALRPHHHSTPLARDQQEFERAPDGARDPPAAEIEPQLPDLVVTQHPLPGRGFAGDRLALDRRRRIGLEVAAEGARLADQAVDVARSPADRCEGGRDIPRFSHSCVRQGHAPCGAPEYDALPRLIRPCPAIATELLMPDALSSGLPILLGRLASVETPDPPSQRNAIVWPPGTSAVPASCPLLLRSSSATEVDLRGQIADAVEGGRLGVDGEDGERGAHGTKNPQVAMGECGNACAGTFMVMGNR
jgi:hypothetical protein